MLIDTDGNSVVRVVKDDFNESRDDAWPGAFMKQRLTLFFTHVTELIGQHKLDC